MHFSESPMSTFPNSHLSTCRRRRSRRQANFQIPTRPLPTHARMKHVARFETIMRDSVHVRMHTRMQAFVQIHRSENLDFKTLNFGGLHCRDFQMMARPSPCSKFEGGRAILQPDLDLIVDLELHICSSPLASVLPSYPGPQCLLTLPASFPLPSLADSLAP